jgi:hypothetical protein
LINATDISKSSKRNRSAEKRRSIFREKPIKNPPGKKEIINERNRGVYTTHH